jgi:hypothetical protein
MRFKFVTSIAVIALLVSVVLAWRNTSMGVQSRDLQSYGPSPSRAHSYLSATNGSIFVARRAGE